MMRSPKKSRPTSFVSQCKIVQIKLTDQGEGVYWPISWLQMAAVTAAVPGGVATVVAAILVFLHPVPN